MKNDPYGLEERGTTFFAVSADDYLDARFSMRPILVDDDHPFKAAEVRGDVRYDKGRHEVLVNRLLLNVQGALVRACPEKYEMKDGRIAPLNLTARLD